jgi:hypothetical protein
LEQSASLVSPIRVRPGDIRKAVGRAPAQRSCVTPSGRGLPSRSSSRRTRSPENTSHSPLTST